MGLSSALGRRGGPVTFKTLALVLAAALLLKTCLQQQHGLPGLIKGGLWERSGPLGEVTASEVAADMWAPGSQARIAPGRMLGASANLNGKLAVVTGANTGLGKETARVLASQGCHVVLACRNEGRCREAASDIMTMSAEDAERGGSVEVMQLDLASLASVRAFAEVLLSKMDEGWGYNWQRIDFLINNAGIMALPNYEESIDGYEKQFATNHLGHFFLTTLLLPRLGEGSRIINLSSVAHKLAPPTVDPRRLPLTAATYSYGPSIFGTELPAAGVPAYGISKASNILFSLELRKRLAGTGVVVVAGHPGIVHTDLGRYDIINEMVYTVFCPVVKWFLRRSFLKTLEQGAATTLCMALHPVPTPAVGEDMTEALYWSDCEPVGSDEEQPDRMYRELVFNETKAAQLWERSEMLVRSAMSEVDRAPYTWDDPMKIMNSDDDDTLEATGEEESDAEAIGRDRFEAKAAIEAELARAGGGGGGVADDVGIDEASLGFLEQPADGEEEKKEEL